LMKAVTKEDIPIETGWLNDQCVWPYNAAIVAQMYLWAGFPDLARKTFIGFLNHASPLHAWREEQSLQDAPFEKYIGDMPHNWASAECIRYLRHMMVLEDERVLRLFVGVGLPELNAGKKIELTDTPTKWGRISVSLEPIDQYTWRTKFKHGEYDKRNAPPLDTILMPRKLAGVFRFNGAKGVTANINGNDVVVSVESNKWECEWISYESRKIRKK